MTGTKLQTMAAVTLMAALTAGTAGALARSDGDGPEINTVAQVETKPAQGPAETLRERYERLRSEFHQAQYKSEELAFRLGKIEKEWRDEVTKQNRAGLPEDDEARKQHDEAIRQMEKRQDERLTLAKKVEADRARDAAAEAPKDDREQVKGRLDQTSKQVEQLKNELAYLELKLRRLAVAATEPTDEEVRKQLDLARKKVEKLEQERALQDMEIETYKSQLKAQAPPTGITTLDSGPGSGPPISGITTPPPATATPPPVGRAPFDLADNPAAPPPASRLPFETAGGRTTPLPPAPAPQIKRATVLSLNLPGLPWLSAVISGERDRVTMINMMETQKRDTFRPSGTVADVSVASAGNIVTLNLKGAGMGRTAVFDRRDNRWSVVELGSAATSIKAHSIGVGQGRDGGMIGLEIDAPEVRRLAAFDILDRKWITRDLAEPVKESVSLAVSSNTVSYLTGRTIWVYSTTAKRWSALELKQAMAPGEFNTIMATEGKTRLNQIVIPDGDLIHAYNFKDGSWGHIDTKDDK